MKDFMLIQRKDFIFIQVDEGFQAEPEEMATSCTVPGSVQEASGWGATRYGSVACGSKGNGRTVGLDDLVDPFQPWDSMILWLCEGFDRGQNLPWNWRNLCLSIFFNTIHSSALCNCLARVSHWRHSPVAVPTLKELERRISISTKKKQTNKMKKT